MKLIVIIGKTATGKDTVARYLKNRYGVEPIVSYATRPMRDCEVNGREHWFISAEEMEELKRRSDELLAYTKFPKTGYEYCASSLVLNKKIAYSYILNPEGLEWMREHREDLDICVLALNTTEEAIRQQAKGRGDREEDIKARLDSEREQFDDFFAKIGDEAIDANCSIEELFRKVDSKVTDFLKAS